MHRVKRPPPGKTVSHGSSGVFHSVSRINSMSTRESNRVLASRNGMRSVDSSDVRGRSAPRGERGARKENQQLQSVLDLCR